MRIPQLVVDHYYEDIFFMVDTDLLHAQATIPRVTWMRKCDMK